MFKKSVVLVLALMLALSTMLVGCGDKKKEEGNNPTDTTKNDTTKTDTKKEKPVKLTWYTIGTPQKDVDLVEEELNKYLLEKINATVDLIQIDWGEYTQKMQVKIGSGENFDIMYTCSWANDYATNVAKGALLPLNDLLDQYGQGIKENLHPLFFEGATINGKVYGLPTNKELGWQAMWVVNKDLADKYDMDINQFTTLESLEPYLEIIKQNEPGVTPLMLDKDSYPYIPNLDGGILGDNMPFQIKFDDPSKIVNKYETEEFMKIAETMYKYNQKGYLHADRAIKILTDERKAGKYFIAKAHYNPYAEIVWQKVSFPSSKIAIAPIHEPFANNGSTRGAMQGISITSKHPEKAMEFLNLLYTDKYVINLIDYGIDGVHYNTVDDAHIALTDRGKDSYEFPSFSIGNIFNTVNYEGTPDDIWEKYQEFNDSCINAPTLGFTPNLESVKTEISSITNVNEELYATLILGIVDPKEYVPKAIDKFKDAGIEEVMAELQKQYDEWLASK